ncbi:MAG: CRTAC1 family protein [Myxococcota bacterium]
MLWSLLLGCPAEPDPVRVPTPVPAPLLGDTGLPAPVEPPPPRATIDVEPIELCPDIGRDARYFDPHLIGETPPEGPRLWAASGLVIDDFDGNGALDIIAPGDATPAFWQRGADGWRDRGALVFPDLDASHAVGGSAADYDGDGDPDLFITRYGQPSLLLRNDGTGFTDVTASAQIPLVARRTTSSSWGDFDGDGWLDLFVGSYGAAPPSAWDSDMGPGDPSLLLRNRGDGTFEDVSHRIPQSVHDAYTFMSAWYDVDADGFPELFVVNDFGWVRPSVMFWNRGGELQLDDGTALFHPGFAGMGLAVADLNGDLAPDFAQTSYQAISLLLTQQTPFATEGTAWIEFSQAMGLAADPTDNQIFGWGAQFGDIDNDADDDLVLGFGKWDEYQNQEFQYDGLWLLEDTQFLARGDWARFRVADRRSTRGVLLVDLDRDGWLDITKRMLDAPLTVHMSRCSSTRHWSEITLVDPTSPNARAIGARVTVSAGPHVVTRWVTAGSTSMFSSGPPELHFGLGEELLIDRIDVVWPDGDMLEIDREIAADRRIRITRQAP